MEKKQAKEMAKIFLLAAELVATDKATGCCRAIELAIRELRIIRPWAARCECAAMLSHYFYAYEGGSYYWKWRVIQNHNFIVPYSFRSLSHQRACVTPRIIALQLCALITMEECNHE